MVQNVILITIDCLRFDFFLEEYFPKLFSSLNNCVSFTQAFANGPWTPPSFNSIFTSTYPFKFRDYCPIPSEKTTIAEVLRRYKYKTCAVNSNIFLTKYFNYNRGFDEYIEKSPNKNRIFALLSKLRKLFSKHLPFFDNLIRKVFHSGYLNKNNIHLTALDVIRIVVDKLDNLRSSKFFIWLHFLDVHPPFLPPRKYINKINPMLTNREINRLNIKFHEVAKKVFNANKYFSHKEIKCVKDLYTAGLYYIDSCLNILFLKLKRLNLLEDTLIIFTADHGELFLEHGSIEHPALFYDELLHIPLEIKIPGKVTREFVEKPVDLINISPTILDCLGLPPEETFDGKSLFGEISDSFPEKDYYIISQSYIETGHKKTIKSSGSFKTFSIRKNNWKYVFNQEKNIEELFDLNNDPKERINKRDEHPERVRVMREVGEKIIFKQSERAKIKKAINNLKNKF
ncbi:MAG: sulfatase-like hydrolase/transferase [Promethearchaeota archaeon]